MSAIVTKSVVSGPRPALRFDMRNHFRIAFLLALGAMVLPVAALALDTPSASRRLSTGLSSAQVDSTYSASSPSMLATYGYQRVLTSLWFEAEAKSATQAEQAGVFRMTSTTGRPGDVKSYKMALGAETTCGVGSSSCWGMSVIGSFNRGYSTKNHQVAFEVDHNNLTGTNCLEADYGIAGNVPCASLVITGSGSSQITAALDIQGNNQSHNAIQIDTAGASLSTLRNYANTQNLAYDTGSHINGVFLNGTYSKTAIYSPGFTVNGTGDVVARAVSAEGDVSSRYGRLTPVIYRTVAAQRPCNIENQGVTAYIKDSTTASFNAPISGGGSIAIGVVCNGADYVVH
ncbi:MULTISPECIES: hypothetical protein [unclassified Methylobacterium]|uniref:hypothetical protein n=1 Tax=unclassified Methylobacterium TaxID=2615210 RepID=UPI0011C2093D|nr:MULTISPECIES: hypothetical protein [unclassified Methylobacterium]QEE39028.1 hypothetical protein FVA80_08770 [Methylobacterium sp. WL1]TXN54167.1 hypothetical protein FV241_25185 [Methylobacterium sp. WL2]